MSDMTLPISINQATTRPQWDLREAVEGYARHGVCGISVWPEKLEEYGVGEARKLLDDNGMQVAAYCVGGMFANYGAADEGNVERLCRRIDEAASIGAQCMIAVVGTLSSDSLDLSEARRRVADGIDRLLPNARSAGVPLAIEAIHPMRAGDLCCINTLEQARDLCDEFGDGIGIAVDAYHVWWDPSLERQLRRANGRILAFQVCDWLQDTKEILDDRGMMGDGVIDLPQIRKWVEESGYCGFLDVEIMSARNWWKRNPDEVVKTCLERAKTVC